MIKKIDSSTIINRHLGWFYGNMHFASTDYSHPEKMHYGVLRTLDDVYIQPSSGFEMHGHKNIEIITYIVSGELTHHDSLGNRSTAFMGDAFYMCAGSGIEHEEHNNGDEPVHVLQIWIIPDKKDLAPKFSHSVIPMGERNNTLLHLAGGNGDAKININQDANIYVLRTDEPFEIPINVERQFYLVQIEGTSVINKITLNEGEALEGDESLIKVNPTSMSHLLIIEMKK